MDDLIRHFAKASDISPIEYLLSKIKTIERESGIPRTLFAACPNSIAVIRASLRSAKRNNAPIKFAATLNQVDVGGGYTGFTPFEFVKTIRLEAEAINYTGFIMIALDHGGPWLKDLHYRERWSYQDTFESVKKSFEAAIEAGYDLIHVDPTIDITLQNGELINIDVVADRTIELIVHAEKFRRANNYNRIAYEVGTEEVHGGLASLEVFVHFLKRLNNGLKENGLHDVWPCFIVGKVGTDLHTTSFDVIVAKQLTEIAANYGSYIKGHYSDNVMNPEDYPLSGMGAANVGPEFTEREYEGLMELCELENLFLQKGLIAKGSNLREVLWSTVILSGRWKKWLSDSESKINFYANTLFRQEWLIKTGCRYIWESPEVLASRSKLYQNIKRNGVDPEEIILSRIEKSMDKYFNKFNLVDLNDHIEIEHSSLVER